MVDGCAEDAERGSWTSYVWRSPSPSGDRLTRSCDTRAGGGVDRPVSWVGLVLVIATANWTNRANDGLQTPLS
jgi:hypothetical protein